MLRGTHAQRVSNPLPSARAATLTGSAIDGLSCASQAERALHFSATMSSNRIDDGPSIDPGLQSLFAEFHRRAAPNGERVTLRAWLDRAEAWRILHALREAGGNRSAAARSLGIGRRTLYTKMEKLGIHPSWEASGDPTPVLRASA